MGTGLLAVKVYAVNLIAKLLLIAPDLRPALFSTDPKFQDFRPGDTFSLDSDSESEGERHRGNRGMKITALLVLKVNGDGSDPVILSIASDVSHFGYFQRSSVKEFIVFVSRTVAKRTPPGQRQSVQHEEYKVHSYNRNDLCTVGFMDDHYPVRSAFSLLNQVLDEYLKSFGDSWRSAQADNTQPWPYLNEALTKYQDPAEADKLLKIQRELDETKIILHKTIDSVLARGEKLDSLVEKSSDLSAASQMFYKQAKKTNQCCTIL
ncbi:hypothetical protein SAY87_029927 [Trapa incisa]|uniref:VAMP-like protein YKT61 n=1 Tax=Trapa incisa TaxID=236973 RepID=A0AAN7K5A6_9MYRT|nr:hypothetical protein SAY87_029927 [Trapa incisa]